MLTRVGIAGRPEMVIPKFCQDMLADMAGTTRPRLSFLLNEFLKPGFIGHNGGLQVFSSLLNNNIVLHD